MSETVLYISCAILASFRPTFISQFTSLPQHDAGPIAHILILASSASSVAENLVPTGMIGYTARVYGRVRTSNGHGSQAMRILAMLMESGVLYALIQVTLLLLMSEPNPSLEFLTSSCIFQSTTQIVTIRPGPVQGHTTSNIHFGPRPSRVKEEAKSSDLYTEPSRYANESPRSCLSEDKFYCEEA
ncbi:hypothetical protein BDV98DRAFT_598087 [Pterulicium gracile]|uniref:Uncharacterized protein n=1 Tax=Pterulicium gracile TaxID=1884261 RepID=A0A5C3Q361_9AGAR|nr:hypothetical protein BDV98DRAFT_598087 [Pterula gracilis]